MQPEDIIQQKEWNELSGYERSLLGDLAPTEQEYNLLKKIMLVSREEMEDVPAVNPAIYTALKQQVKPKQKSYRLWYSAAAAAAILIIFIAIYTGRQNQQQDTLVKNNQPTVIINDTARIIPSPVNDSPLIKQQDNIAIAPAKKKIHKEPEITTIRNTDYAINTTVASDPDLLSLITEVN